MLPTVGLNPTTPQNAAGMRIEPPVSLPMDACPNRSATATPEPLDEPPACRAGSQGLQTSPVHGFSPVAPSAISCMFVLANTSAPASRRRRTTALSCGGSTGKGARVPAAMGAPSSWNRSFTLIHAPSSGLCCMRAGSRRRSSISCRASPRARAQSTHASGLNDAVSAALCCSTASSSSSERRPCTSARACASSGCTICSAANLAATSRLIFDLRTRLERFMNLSCTPEGSFPFGKAPPWIQGGQHLPEALL